MTPPSEPKPQPLSGTKVLDLTTEVAGPTATKFLAGFGADVLKIEPPGGDPTRQWGAFAGAPDAERSGWFLYLNTGKASAVLDPSDPADGARLNRLVAAADVVIDDHTPAQLRGIDLASVQQRRPEQVVVSITPYGQDGPYAERRASALTLYAAGGVMWLTGEPYREPVKSYGPQALYQTGFHAFAAAVVAITGARLHGEGRHLDISVQETVASMLEVNGPNGFNYHTESYRAGNVLRAGWGVYPCADGYIGIHALPNNLPALFRAIGQPELIEAYADPVARGRDNDHLEANLYAWCGDRTARQIFEIGQRERAPFAYLPTLPELLAWPGLDARDYWIDVEHPEAGTLRYPGAPFLMREGAFQLRRAPLLDEHRHLVDEWIAASGQPG
jgi:crotonobetainyl-CoA:carnitine CoA-transferase CaiB-like acyl-CoA transferase